MSRTSLDWIWGGRKWRINTGKFIKLVPLHRRMKSSIVNIHRWPKEEHGRNFGLVMAVDADWTILQRLSRTNILYSFQRYSKCHKSLRFQVYPVLLYPYVLGKTINFPSSLKLNTSYQWCAEREEEEVKLTQQAQGSDKRWCLQEDDRRSDRSRRR